MAKAIIVAAGKGQRMNAEINKVMMCIDDKPVIVHAIEPFEESEMIDGILIVGNNSEIGDLKKIVEKYPQLRNVIEKIQNDRRIKIALLFGSYAKRIAKQDSDIDVYIETADKKIKQEISLIDSKLNIKIGKYNNSNLLIKEIEKNHVVIKGIENYYEKNKFFE